MRGSPIIQDGKMVDSIAHVLLNDPTKDYCIFIEKMLDAIEYSFDRGKCPCLLFDVCDTMIDTERG